MKIAQNEIKIFPNRLIKSISFGNAPLQNFQSTILDGETFVVANKELYFDRYTPQDILNNKFEFFNNPQTNKKSKIKEFFLPFRRISQISNINTEDIDGCKIVTNVSSEEFKTIKALSMLERDKRAAFWLPSILIENENKDINIHNKYSYKNINEKLPTKWRKSLLASITNYLLNSIADRKSSNLVIAVGNSEKDLDYINPFKRLGLDESDVSSFAKIKDLPFRSAFICNENTSEQLKYNLKKLAARCNFDGHLRFLVLDTNYDCPINKTTHAILLLQKDFANYSQNYRNSISPSLKEVLTYHKLEPPNIDISAKWIKKEENISLSFFNNLKNFLLNNKISTTLILTAIIVPLYTKYLYNHKEKIK